MQTIECSRIENKELLYPHLQLGDGALMQAKLSEMEAYRSSIQQRLLTAPLALQLEDETVEDDMDEKALDEEHEVEVHIEVVSTEDNPTAAPETDVQQVLPPYETTATPDETTLEAEAVAGRQPPSVSAPSSTVDVDRIAMPPPPPRIIIPLEPVPSTVDETSTVVPESTILDPPAPAAPTPPQPLPDSQGGAEESERETLLRQLDLLRLKFKQSVIPTDIETQTTPAVRLVVERNLVNLKRARTIPPF